MLWNTVPLAHARSRKNPAIRGVEHCSTFSADAGESHRERCRESLLESNTRSGVSLGERSGLEVRYTAVGGAVVAKRSDTPGRGCCCCRPGYRRRLGEVDAARGTYAVLSAPLIPGMQVSAIQFEPSSRASLSVTALPQTTQNAAAIRGVIETVLATAAAKSTRAVLRQACESGHGCTAALGPRGL